MPSYPTVTQEMLQEMDRQINGRLTAPASARKKTQTNYKTKQTEEHIRWNESAQVVSVECASTISGAGDEHDVYKVEFGITATRGSGMHVGTKVFLTARVNPKALDAGDKEDGQFKMSRGSLVRLLQLVRASGFPVKGGLSSAQMAAYYPANGQSPLVGKEVLIEIHQNESDKAPTGWNEEVSNIFPLVVGAASAEV